MKTSLMILILFGLISVYVGLPTNAQPRPLPEVITGNQPINLFACADLVRTIRPMLSFNSGSAIPDQKSITSLHEELSLALELGDMPPQIRMVFSSDLRSVILETIALERELKRAHSFTGPWRIQYATNSFNSNLPAMGPQMSELLWIIRDQEDLDVLMASISAAMELFRSGRHRSSTVFRIETESYAPFGSRASPIDLLIPIKPNARITALQAELRTLLKSPKLSAKAREGVHITSIKNASMVLLAVQSEWQAKAIRDFIPLHERHPIVYGAPSKMTDSVLRALLYSKEGLYGQGVHLILSGDDLKDKKEEIKKLARRHGYGSIRDYGNSLSLFPTLPARGSKHLRFILDASLLPSVQTITFTDFPRGE